VTGLPVAVDVNESWELEETSSLSDLLGDLDARGH
jgi:hypothetical protein